MWRNIALLLVFGYVCLGKSFAYIGIPSVKIFVGEVALVAFAITRPGALFGRWVTSLTSGNGLSGYGWGYLIFLQYGLFEFVRGLSLGRDVVLSSQTLVFNVYPMFLFLGIHAGLADPNFLRSLVRGQSWLTGVYGTAYLLYLHQFDGLFFPGTAVSMVGQPGGASLALLGLLYFEDDLKKVAVPLILNAFVMLGVQVRSEWVAFLIGLAVLEVLRSRARRMVVALSLLAGLLAVGYIADVRIPGPKSRGGEISTREIAGRALSVVAPDWAATETNNYRTYAGTLTWRTRWWHAIWDSVNADPATALFGHGYGYPLSRLVAYIGDDSVRTPHNAFMYALGYTGWIGVIIFYLFLGALFHALWHCYKVTGNAFGLIILSGSVAASFFGSLFETPFGAIPLFIITGAALAPLAVADRGWLIRGLPVRWPLKTGSSPWRTPVEQVYSGRAR